MIQYWVQEPIFSLFLKFLQNTTFLHYLIVVSSNNFPIGLVMKTHFYQVLSTKYGFNVLYIDIDSFKAFNDSHGFREGVGDPQNLHSTES
jgi:hypothetical protein